LRRDAAELELDAVFEPAAVGMCKLAPRTDGEREARVPDEVVAGEPVLELLGGEDDEELFWGCRWTVKSPAWRLKLAWSALAT
jgi:hypothetical protein